MAKFNEAYLTFLANNLTQYELWGQLAEEASELAQAALKMQRQCFPHNPPRKDWAECVTDVIEEHADLALCFAVLGWNDKQERDAISVAKLARWVDSVKSAQARESV